MQFITLDDLHSGIDPGHDAIGKGLAGVAAIDQHTFNQLQILHRAVDSGQGAVAVRDISRGYGDGVRQALHVYGDVALDAGDLLARVIALLFGAIGVLYALRVND